MIIWLRDRFEIINADKYRAKFLDGSLEKEEICFSFDDALKCQYDVALPILQRYGIKAFFFVYSSAFTDSPDYLEIFRFFRTSEFMDIDNFYAEFFQKVIAVDRGAYLVLKKKYERLDYLSAFPYYSENDKWFRYLRDQHLGPEKYNSVMMGLMNERSFDIEKAKGFLWMTEDNIRTLNEEGHVIGLHSFSHPTQMSKLSASEQLAEYKKNLEHLGSITENRNIDTMSHPCGDYNNDTLKALISLGIQLGFRSNMAIEEIKTPLEIPRENHANIFKEMRQ